MPAAKVERSQRERLYGAMVACVAEKGYDRTSVADLLALSGVSRRTFYELFSDKEACLVATIEAIVAATMATAGRSYSGEGRWQEEGLETLRAIFRLCAEQPAAARLCVLEAYRAGRVGLEPVMRVVDELEAMSLTIQGSDDRRGETLASLIRTVSGGIHRVMYNRLRDGCEAELPECVEETWRWAVGFSPLPGPLRARVRRATTASPAPPFAAHVPSERILRGFAATVAKRGFAATTIAAIAAQTHISQATFYAHFAGKRDAMVAALDSSGAQMVAATLPAVRRSEGWPEAVRVAVESMCAFLAAEPAFARLRALEAYAAGPWAVDARDRAMMEILEVTLSLDETAPRLEGVAGEATLGALNAVFYDAVGRGGGETVLAAAPLGTYVVLAPLLGAEAAYQVCCE